MARSESPAISQDLGADSSDEQTVAKKVRLEDVMGLLLDHNKFERLFKMKEDRPVQVVTEEAAPPAQQGSENVEIFEGSDVDNDNQEEPDDDDEEDIDEIILP